MTQNSIKKNALLNVIYTIINLVFPLITYPYVARVLSTTGMGKVSFFTSISNYAVMVGSLGISTYGIRAVANARDDEKRLSKVTSELLILNLIITLIVVVFLFGSFFFVDKFATEPVLFVINIAIILSTPFGLSWFYSGLEQYEYITKRTIIFKAVSVFLVFSFVKSREDYPVYAGITAFSMIGAYLCNLLYSTKFTRIKIDSSLEFKKHFKPMLLLFASILAVSVYTNLDTVMLGFINGDRDVGLYSVASKSRWLLLAAVNAISAVLLPRLSNYFSNQNYEAYYKTLKKSVSFIFLITIPLSIFFIIEASDVIYILGGKDYSDAIGCMQILMPILIISGFSNVTGNQVLIPQGKDSCFMRAVVVGAGIDVVLNVALMPSLGCVGAAIATLFAELSQMSIQLYYAKADIQKNIQPKTIIKAFLAAIVPALFIIFTSTLLILNPIVSLIVRGFFFFALYSLLLYLSKESYFIELISLVVNRIKRV